MLVLKGVAFALTVYPDRALRCFEDIDILVAPDDFLRAFSILESLGYSRTDNRFDPSNKFRNEETFLPPERQETLLRVELHWNLHYCSRLSGSLGFEELFRDATCVEDSGLVLDVLHPIDALIHSALHLALFHPNNFRITWIYDIALLAEGLDVPTDWRRLQERSTSMQARLAVERCLRLAQTWIGLQIPPEVADFSEWPKPEKAEFEMLHHAPGWRENTYSTFKLSWPGAVSPSTKARHVFRLLFPRPEYMHTYYPSSHEWLMPLSYVRRWLKWLKQLRR